VGRKLLSSTEQWCVQMQHIFGKLGWTRVGEIRGVNRDGSTEWFYAYDIPVRDSNPGAWHGVAAVMPRPAAVRLCGGLDRAVGCWIMGLVLAWSILTACASKPWSTGQP